MSFFDMCIKHKDGLEILKVMIANEVGLSYTTCGRLYSSTLNCLLMLKDSSDAALRDLAIKYAKSVFASWKITHTLMLGNHAVIMTGSSLMYFGEYEQLDTLMNLALDNSHAGAHDKINLAKDVLFMLITLLVWRDDTYKILMQSVEKENIKCPQKHRDALLSAMLSVNANNPKNTYITQYSYFCLYFAINIFVDQDKSISSPLFLQNGALPICPPSAARIGIENVKKILHVP